jgi:hypothetical protein
MQNSYRYMIDSKLILDYIKSRCKIESLHDEILNSVVILLKVNHNIKINSDIYYTYNV